MIINITPDKERARSIKELTEKRKLALAQIKKSKFPTLIAENYYEIIKELLTAILLTQGKKSIGENSHKDLIEETSKLINLNTEERLIIDDLRIKRNKSFYEGQEISENYLKTNEEDLAKIIKRLETELNKRI